MDDQHVRVLIQAFAINAEIESMKIANKERFIVQGDYQYGEQAFINLSMQLEQLSRDLS